MSTVFVCHLINPKIMSASDDFTMKMWDFSSGKLLKSLKYDNYVANSICYSPNGSYIASNYGKDIKLWDALFNPLMTLLGHSETAFSIRFSWDNQMIVSGSKDTTVKLFDVSTGKLMKSFESIQ